ncbi:YiiX/YebB-like N1pC/P60 family cysteine hydrolase [Desulfurococcus mucosus]|uniref:Permuted papain-like amidase enzyme, YaeF/YiiX, C92 family n=1 Tax=Desulfurococcus mucosus (strain ATCC 35584 / DSM 2162 / JCM 9187 / O7/1) TaxID=765177 RepID=E8R776_DESM0|nr:YiiX/YebB-like N1pC/P60 family cysteine hydrolase [Desulfurococcus mucosus]ADV65541.1 hypothetical protein Desmu_1245 [Desulfurococcus mucosus DSM 2162]
MRSASSILLVITLVSLLTTLQPAVAAIYKSEGVYTHPYPSGIRPGDIVIGHSPDLTSKLIPGYWSHVGMVVWFDSARGDWIVVESLPDGGVQLNPLKSFLSRYDTVAVLRVATTDYIRSRAVAFALSQLGKPYDWGLYTKQVYGSSYYCSELVWASYKAVGGPDIDANPGFSLKYLYAVAPQEIYDDGDTYIIYYHSA